MTALTTLKIAAVAPIPSAIVSTATTLKPGFASSDRSEVRMCRIIPNQAEPAAAL